MTITFFSNFLLHHQTPFCEAMVRHIGDGFRFVATEPIPGERLNMGYENLEDAPYAVNAYRDEASYQEAMRLGYESDVVIIGSAPDVFIEKRLAENKLTFRYSERFFKKFRWRFDPRVWRMRYKKDIRYRKKNLHMLCASAYTAPDCRFIFSYPNKTYQWGYFPVTETYESAEYLISHKKKNSLLWVGRMIDWKHPEAALTVAERLKKDGIEFELNMIGNGEMERYLKELIRSRGLEQQVRLLGSMPPESVRNYMRKADIYLFTSDRQEGWGAVLNEAMSSACAVVACREIGSVPFLITHGENGLIYDKHGANTLYDNVKRLIQDKYLRERLQKNAYDTIKSVWNADAATERLLCLIDCMQKGEQTPYTDGPCSRC